MVHLIGIPAVFGVGVLVGYLYGAKTVADVEKELAKFRQVLAEYKSKL
jgi:hypothetical protein